MKAAEAVQFGTDGWRAGLADGFTFTNLRRAIQAYAVAMRLQGEAHKPVVIGYDTRMLSREFAQTAAEVLAGNGYTVWLANDVTPTPSISKAIVREGLAGGLIITASHNPASYNGLKIKGAYGGPAFPELTQAVEAALDREPVRSAPMGSDEWKRRVTLVDLRKAYVQDVKQYIDMKWVKKAAGRVVVDPMHGAGCGYLEELLKGTAFRLTTLHGDRRGDLGGLHPEPIPTNLAALAALVKKEKAKAGLATDGDADRVGVVDGRGHVVDTQHVMALLLWHLVKHRGFKGSVVKTNAVTVCLDRMAKAYGLPVRQTKIGFKHIANWIIQEPVVIGGEESGGMSFYGYMPERDGLLASLLILEMMGRTGLPLHALVAQMEKEFGRCCYRRVDARLTEPGKHALIRKLESFEPKEVGGLAVKEKTTLDGFKFLLEGDAWLLLRFSGTEPLLRVYAEASSDTLMKRIIQFGMQLVQEASK